MVVSLLEQFWYVPLLLLSYFIFRGYAVKKVFKLPVWCLYIGSDIGGNNTPYYINKKNVHGAPDALFFNLFTLRFIVGEYKSRVYRGHVTSRERYQVILYVGLISPFLWPRCRGYIVYGCGTVIYVPYVRKTFKALLGLRDELKQSKKNWRPVNSLPLDRR